MDSYKYYRDTSRKEIGKWSKIKELEELLDKPFYRKRYN